MIAKLFTIVTCFLGIFCSVFTALNDEQSDESNYKILPLIYIKKDNHYHHPTHLLKKVFAKDDQSFSSGTIFTYEGSRDQTFFCPPETDAYHYQKEIQTALDLYEKYSRFQEYSKDLIFSKYCQFEHTFEIREPMTCPTEANPVLRKITQRIKGEVQDELCGREEEGKLYEFFYMACPKFGLWRKLKETWNARNEDYRRFLFGLPFIAVKRNAYQICYNHNKMETMYAKYHLNPTKLSFNRNMEFEENKEFPFRTEEYEYFDKDFEKIKRAYNQVVDTEDEKLHFNYPGPSTPNILTDDVPQYTLHQLVPAIHFPLAIWKKSTFHYANVRPMHRNLLDLWNLIDYIILYDSYKRNIPFEIYTGAFNVPDTNKPIQYVYKDHVEIPEIWIKIVHDSNHKEPYLYEGIAITMKNYELTITEDSIPTVSDCPKNLCFSYFSREEIQEKFPFAAYQICCHEITKEILNYFQIKLQSPYLLRIDPLIG